jgi:hypothetical protein
LKFHQQKIDIKICSFLLCLNVVTNTSPKKIILHQKKKRGHKLQDRHIVGDG